MASKYNPIQGLHVKTGFHKSILKGEDAWLQKPGWVPSEQIPAPVDLFGIFDGHGGKQAATFCTKHFASHLEAAISKRDSTPASNPPEDVKDCQAVDSDTWEVWESHEQLTARLPQSLVDSFESLQDTFLESSKVSGTTATVACLAGWQLLVANVGDSCAYLDTGNEVLQISGNHRLEDSKSEKERIRSQGFELSRSKCEGRPTGPLRVWPGGLAMGRTIGDFEAGEIVLSTPEVRQVTLPEQGGRVVIASDGLWDAVSAKTALHHIRGTPASKAARELVQLAVKGRDLKDDITVLVIDATPSLEQKLPSLLSKDGSGRLQSDYTTISPVNVYHPLEDGAVGQEAWRRLMWERRLAAVKQAFPSEFESFHNAEDLLSGSLSETHLESGDEIDTSPIGQTILKEFQMEEEVGGEWSEVPEKSKAVPVRSRKHALPSNEHSPTGATPAPKAMREAPLSPPPGFGPLTEMSSCKEASQSGRSRGRGRNREYSQGRGRGRKQREAQVARQSIGGFEVSAMSAGGNASESSQISEQLNGHSLAPEGFAFLSGGGFELQPANFGAFSAQSQQNSSVLSNQPNSEAQTSRSQRQKFFRGRGRGRRGRAHYAMNQESEAVA